MYVKKYLLRDNHTRKKQKFYKLGLFKQHYELPFKNTYIYIEQNSFDYNKDFSPRALIAQYYTCAQTPFSQHAKKLF